MAICGLADDHGAHDYESLGGPTHCPGETCNRDNALIALADLEKLVINTSHDYHKHMASVAEIRSALIAGGL